MMHKAFPMIAAGLFLAALPSASAQQSKFQKQIQRFDLGISAAGILNKTVSGPVTKTFAPNAGQTVTDSPSNTVGVDVNVRYVARPFVGFEFNGGYARYTENYTNSGSAPSVNGVQTSADEFTFGYLVTPDHPILGLEPFASVGTGSIAFRPTSGGGQNLPSQARQAYYYSVGLQKPNLTSHLGVRIGFRQLFYLAPDYGQNYLTILKRTITSEPTVGFYLHF